MMYKHFIAALAAALLCLVGTISAQKNKKPLTQAEFEQLVINDAPQAYKLAVAKKLNFEQLRFFCFYEGSNERNTQYNYPLHEIYWQQLTHKDKLNYEHLSYLEESFFYEEPKTFPYKFSRTFAYVLAHRDEFKKVWGDSLYNQYIDKNLTVGCYEIDLFFYNDSIPPIENREKKAELYFALVKQQLPEYEAKVRADICWRCVYKSKRETAQYYYWLNKYVTDYENDPDKVANWASMVIFHEDNLNYKQLGLNWINKALSIQKTTRYYIYKANLEYELGQIDAARQSIKLSELYAPDVDDSTSKYRRRIAELIANSK